MQVGVMVTSYNHGDWARLMAGEFSFGGERLAVGLGGDPWRRALPNRRFAVALHSFDWVRDLIAAGEGGAREALRLWLLRGPVLARVDNVSEITLGEEADLRIPEDFEIL